MKKENVKTYSINENTHSGLEFELHYMPRFLSENKGAFEPHSHEFYQIIWFMRGHGVHQVDFTDYPVTDNTIFFIAPGQVHAFSSQCCYEGVIVHFNASFMSDEESSESLFLKYSVFNTYGSLPCCRIGHEEAGKMMSLVHDMELEYPLTDAFAHKDYMKNLVRLFLIRAQRGGDRMKMPKLYVSSVANDMFVRFCQLLEQNFRHVHTVKEYAGMLHLSPRTLNKYVRQSSNHSPLDVINKRIVLEAKRQICHTALSVKETAFTLGFEDPSYFVKFFKRLTGCIPSEFRKKQWK